MRGRRWLLDALLLVVVALLPVTVGAQGMSDLSEADVQAAPARTGRTVAYGGQEYFLPAPRERIVLPTGLPASYTVVQGDTLWAISRRFLNDPLLWPLLWEANVGLVPNPHLIYPGQQLVFPGGMAVPSGPMDPGMTARAEAANPLSALAFRPRQPQQMPEYERGGFAFEDLFDPNAPHPVAGEGIVASAGFISPSAYVGPQIVEAELPYPDIMQSDIVYLNIGSVNGVAPGAIYEVVRQRRPVYHPHRPRSKLGELMQQVGRVRIVCVQPTASIAIVTKAHSYIEVGDFVVPFTPTSVPMVTRSPDTDVCEPARGNVRGAIVDARSGGYNTSDAAILGSGDVVYIDVGADERVVPGQYFVVFRESRLGDRYPMLQIGELVVIKTERQTATALISAVRQPMHVGDYIQLK
jgi:LysM repeat protein